MEIALDPRMPTYAGGLGILAGDTLRSAADMQVPIVAVTLIHRKGYLHQRIDATGWQVEEPVNWPVEQFLAKVPERVFVSIEGRNVQVGAWKLEVAGISGFKIPVFLLDSDLPENSAWDRALTDHLYGGDAYYRLCQEMILGIGGLRMLRALGHNELKRYHMNEGHASLLGLELLDERARSAGRADFNADDLAAVRKQCVFTTHTPVAAGHDKFPMELVQRVTKREDLFQHHDVFCCEGELNLTFLALNLSRYVNGVAKRHAEVAQLMFANYQIDAITNGVHAATWVCPSFQQLFDRFIPGWRQDNFSLRFGHSLPREEIWSAHLKAKSELGEWIWKNTGAPHKDDIFTIGFARRATSYKRADLLLRDVDRLRQIARSSGRIRVVYAGKAHPNDNAGKGLIQRILHAKDSLKPEVEILFLANYDMELAKLLVSGVDLWLNTPQAPMEASGTSGMKAALNGVPSFSILDGWWHEGWIEGETGWAIGETCAGMSNHERTECEASSLYAKLERSILPAFYKERSQYIDIMRHCISVNGSFFTTQRMLQQYVLKAYFD